MYAVTTRHLKEGMGWEGFTTGTMPTDYLIPMMDEIENVKKPSEKPSSKCDKVTIKMVSPAQATVERAESEIKRRKKEEEKLQPMPKQQKLTRKTIKPYPNCLIM